MEYTDWKAKSLARTKEIKQLKKRIKELKLSRDSWKEKSIGYKNRCRALETHLKKTKNLIEKLVHQAI